MQRLNVIDSHTGGEPTRVVLSGGPDLGDGPLTDRRNRFREHFDHFRSAIVDEPRGSGILVGAILLDPQDASCLTGVIFFNNVGYLGMCGHGMIGLVTTLAHTGRIQPGEFNVETPAGIVRTTLHPHGEVSVTNVPSWRARKAVTVDVPGLGPVTGDVAYGGNWFFLVNDHGRDLELTRAQELTDFARRIRQAVNRQGFPEIDHVELFGPARTPGAHSRNFVLCPGNAYDRSACGTGTCAKVACLAADGRLAEQEPWVQESITGSSFTCSYRWLDRDAGRIEPVLQGNAFITAEATLSLDPNDPFCWGIR